VLLLSCCVQQALHSQPGVALVSQIRRLCTWAEGERTSGHLRQFFWGGRGTLPECWRHQSYCRIFNNCIQMISIFTRAELWAAYPWQSKANAINISRWSTTFVERLYRHYSCVPSSWHLPWHPVLNSSMLWKPVYSDQMLFLWHARLGLYLAHVQGCCQQFKPSHWNYLYEIFAART